ncbi:hypothetical protein BDZ97DRAFT_1917719 [Flammula alnicola]|nr:hypothetical protein BDZ97DRAFT_1917719 [Flammula alnicola]
MDNTEIQAGCFGNFFARKSTRRGANSATHVEPPSQTADSSQPQSPYEKSSELKSGEPKQEISYFNPFCDFSYGAQDDWWTLEREPLPSYSAKADTSTKADDISALVEQVLDKYSPSLRDLSLKIHDHPELMFKERYAHDLLTDFMGKQGFKVTKHYLGLDTAWRAEYSQGTGGRVIGINSEMDALQGMGHGCGHNLIAVSGVGVAIALKAALEASPRVSGKIVLLGTPAEESGGGKIILLERGGYDEMDVCLMCHPAPGLPHSLNIGSSNAMQSIQVEYFGRSAHAGGAPWEGTNALDAAFIAYSGISMMRQQMKPDHRVHGVAVLKPEHRRLQKSTYLPNAYKLSTSRGRSDGVQHRNKARERYFDLHQNSVLAQDFADIVGSRYGLVTMQGGSSASTDFGNVSYALPALHPAFAIPTVPNGGNHTPAFAKAARTEAAHEATMVITKGLALTGYRILTDAEFFSRVQASFEQGKVARS